MRTLEANKAFPYIAWTTVILFALFTVHLALELQQSAVYLGDKSQTNVAALKGV